MKRLLIAGAAIGLAMPSIAHAADMPLKAPMPVYNWTGWYIGVNGGGAWSSNQTVPFSGVNGPLAPPPGFFAINEFPTSLPMSLRGGFGGLQTGYNWQVAPMWLIGVETDIQGAHIAGNSVATPIPTAPLAPFTTQVLTESDWFGTVRARMGLLATSTILLYGTGGLAYGETSVGINTFTGRCAPSQTCANGISSSNRTGWAAGGGLEWMFAPRWTLRAEYLHVDLGSQSVTVAPSTQFGGLFISNFTTSAAFQENIVRAAVNFGF